MSRSALISEPPERALTTRVDISTRTSRAGSRSFSCSMASSSEVPNRTAAFSRWISVLAGSAISPSATTQAVVMLSPALARVGQDAGELGDLLDEPLPTPLPGPPQPAAEQQVPAGQPDHPERRGEQPGQQ